MSEAIRREDVQSALEARRELGPEYEDHVVDAFLEKVERRLDERARRVAKRTEPPGLVVPLSSLGLAIPLLGIAGGTAGLAGIVVVCVAVVLVNFAYAFRR